MSCKIERRTERTALGHLVYVVAVISDSEKNGSACLPHERTPSGSKRKSGLGAPL